MTTETDAYLVTLQFGSSGPHKRELVESKEKAVNKATKMSYGKTPADLDAWERRQGNQHTPTRWRHWHRTEDGTPVNVYIRRFTIGEAA